MKNTLTFDVCFNNTHILLSLLLAYALRVRVERIDNVRLEVLSKIASLKSYSLQKFSIYGQE